tara:strand:+ start:1650 stop:2207 length:558 start_codon:yes stop_codon:yes gene_type:complete
MSLLGTLAATLGPAIVQQLFADKSAKSLADEANASISSAESQLSDLEAPQFGVSDQWKNYLRAAKEMDKKQETMAKESVDQAIATTSRYNPRAGAANVNQLLNMLGRMPVGQNALGAQKDMAVAGQAAQSAQDQFAMNRFLGEQDYLRNIATGARQTAGNIELQKSQSQADITSRLMEILGEQFA